MHLQERLLEVDQQGLSIVALLVQRSLTELDRSLLCFSLLLADERQFQHVIIDI